MNYILNIIHHTTKAKSFKKFLPPIFSNDLIFKILIKNKNFWFWFNWVIKRVFIKRFIAIIRP
jgi:hypothetical protein